MYQVYQIDISFDPYEINEKLIGAESEEDLIEHIKDIWPDEEVLVHREDWMDEEEWYCTTLHGKYNEGDKYSIPYFDENQIEEIRESLKDKRFSRIRKIDNLFTDQKYKIIYSNFHLE